MHSHNESILGQELCKLIRTSFYLLNSIYYLHHPERTLLDNSLGMEMRPLEGNSQASILCTQSNSNILSIYLMLKQRYLCTVCN